MDPWIWTLVLLGLAFFLAVLELFVTSGGILAFLSAVSLVGSIVFAFQSSLYFGGVYMLGLIIGLPVIAWYVFKWWPKSIMGRQILLDPEHDPALQPDLKLLAMKQLVGRRGTARSKMMLSGQIEIDGRRINAVSDSEPIEPGDNVVVVNVDGINVIVRKVVDVVPVVEIDDEDEQTVDDPFV